MRILNPVSDDRLELRVQEKSPLRRATRTLLHKARLPVAPAPQSQSTLVNGQAPCFNLSYRKKEVQIYIDQSMPMEIPIYCNDEAIGNVRFTYTPGNEKTAAFGFTTRTATMIDVYSGAIPDPNIRDPKIVNNNLLSRLRDSGNEDVLITVKRIHEAYHRITAKITTDDLQANIHKLSQTASAAANATYAWHQNPSSVVSMCQHD